MDGQALVFLAIGLVGGWGIRSLIKSANVQSIEQSEPSSVQAKPQPISDPPPLAPLLSGPPESQSAQPQSWPSPSLRSGLPLPEVSIALPAVTLSSESPTVFSQTALSEFSALNQAYQRLQTIERFKSSFLARTAHELRSPINSLIGLHQLILEDLCEDPQEEREFIGQAKNAALKILGLLDTLIAAAKVDSGREPVCLQVTSIADLFSSVRELTRLQAANHNVFYEVTVPDPDLTVISDGQWLRVLLINLIEDAIANTHPGTVRLWASAHVDTQHVDLCVQTDRPFSDLNHNLQDLPYASAIDITDLKNLRLSTSLVLAVAQTILSTLKGELVLEPLPGNEQVALIRCRLPAS